MLLRKRDDLTHEQFGEYHKTKHAPLFQSLPEMQQYVRKYVQAHTLPVSLPGMPPPAYDGITKLWFDDTDSLAKLFTAPSYMAAIRPDEEKFLDLHGCGFLVCAENPVIGDNHSAPPLA